MIKKLSLLALLAILLFGQAHAAGGPAQVIAPIIIVWDSNTTVANATIPVVKTVWAGGGTIVSVDAYTGGTGTPSFTVAITMGSTPTNGTNISNCGSISVTTTASSTACGVAFTGTNYIKAVISAVSGTPQNAQVQINLTTTLN